jgi:hypothetical protein
MFKPTRRHNNPIFKQSGINHFSLIRFLEDCEKRLLQENETESAFRVEMMKTYFKEDYEPGKPLKFTGSVLGL